MLIRTYVAPSTIQGLGVFTAQSIRQGAQVWELDRRCDLVFGKRQYKNLPEIIRYNWRRHIAFDEIHDFWLLCGDDGRFFNHSDSPNTIDDDLTSIAARHIKQDEELTCCYGAWARRHLLDAVGQPMTNHKLIQNNPR